MEPSSQLVVFLLHSVIVPAGYVGQQPRPAPPPCITSPFSTHSAKPRKLGINKLSSKINFWFNEIYGNELKWHTLQLNYFLSLKVGV